jgi:enhancing lycopene biosynthesis protein 2
MIEAARIARGAIKPIGEARVEDFDALAMPGGSGAFANLLRDGVVHAEVRRLLTGFADAGKPIAAICIAPVVVAHALGARGIRLTIGNDKEQAAAIESQGARHVECPVNRCVVDAEHKIVSTPAYMLGPGIADVAAGIEECIKSLLSLCAS